MHKPRRTRSQSSSRHVSSSEDESFEQPASLFSILMQDDEDAFYEEGEDLDSPSKTDPHTQDTEETRHPSSSYSSCTSFKVDDIPEDNTRDEMVESQRDFIKYVMSLPTDSTPTVCDPQPENIVTATAIATVQPSPPAKGSNKVGLDHLDNLCRLLEQLGDLKEKNQSLQKRVEYLEGLRMLHDMYKISVAQGYEPPSEKVGNTGFNDDQRNPA
ncbi:hypothetical protein GQR58_022512 [Nymphon striatum]|nr:hypothetical protein GQR58_022512 [Nymphon striatum]